MIAVIQGYSQVVQSVDQVYYLNLHPDLVQLIAALLWAACVAVVSYMLLRLVYG